MAVNVDRPQWRQRQRSCGSSGASASGLMAAAAAVAATAPPAAPANGSSGSSDTRTTHGDLPDITNGGAHSLDGFGAVQSGGLAHAARGTAGRRGVLQRRRVVVRAVGAGVAWRRAGACCTQTRVSSGGQSNAELPRAAGWHMPQDGGGRGFRRQPSSRLPTALDAEAKRSAPAPERRQGWKAG